MKAMGVSLTDKRVREITVFTMFNENKLRKYKRLSGFNVVANIRSME